MKKIILFIILIEILLLIGLISGKMSSGNGLGDLFFVFVLGGILILEILLLFIHRKIRKGILLIIYIFIIGFLLYIFLQFSIFRGAEQKWNGKFFIENNNS